MIIKMVNEFKLTVVHTRIANLRRRAGLWISTKFNRASLQILYVHVYAIDIERATLKKVCNLSKLGGEEFFIGLSL